LTDDDTKFSLHVALGREPEGGLVAMPDIFMTAHRAFDHIGGSPNNVPAV
jgi:hypothetical protein